MKFSQNNVDTTLHWVFRAGFASIFLINGLVAWLKPDEFIHLLNSVPPIQQLGYAENMMWLITANDFLLGLLILSGKRSKFVLAWAGAWLGGVTLIKFLSLL